MINSFCVPLLVLINAFIHLTHAHSYSQSYGGSAGQGYPDSSGTYVTNFGNGNNKHNFLNIDETSGRTSISGTSFSHDESGRPAVENINVDINNQNYRGEHQDPSINRNPNPSRTRITNIGNGVGNKNLLYIHEHGHDQATPRSNQDGNEGYRGEPYNGNEGPRRVITNIGRGINNQVFVNGKRVFPNAAYSADVQVTKATDRLSSVISDVSRYANDFGNGYKNNNRIIIDSKVMINPNTVSNNLNIQNKRQGYKAGEETSNTLINNTEDELLKVIPIYYNNQNKVK